MVKEEVSKKESKGIFERIGPILIMVTVVMAFVIGILWEKVNNLEGGKTVSNAVPTVATAQQAQQPAQTAVTLDQIKKLYGMDLVKFGDANKKLLIVDISDPSCPYCHIAGGKNPELSKQAGDRFTYVSDGGTYVPPVPEFKKLLDQGKASYVFVYTPGHGNGEVGARALYCAYDMGKYWEVHDLLFSNKGYDLMNNTIKNDKSKDGDMADFLASVVDKTAMKTCIDSTKYDQRLGSDTQIASGLGISGTPAFFANTTLFAGAYSYKDMETAIAAALK